MTEKHQDPAITVVKETGRWNGANTILLAPDCGIALILDYLVRITALSNKLRTVNQEFALLSEHFDRLQKTLMETGADHKSQIDIRE